jgi:hypothetical protein
VCHLCQAKIRRVTLACHFGVSLWRVTSACHFGVSRCVSQAQSTCVRAAGVMSVTRKAHNHKVPPGHHGTICGTGGQNVARVAKMWHRWPKRGTGSQNVAQVAKTWHRWPKRGTGGQNVAQLAKMWHRWPKRGTVDQNVAQVAKMWHGWPICGTGGQNVSKIRQNQDSFLMGITKPALALTVSPLQR